MSRRLLALTTTLLVVSVVHGQPAESHQKSQPSEQEINPPEEDESIKTTEYSFNPLQAVKELKIGNYYFKKGSFKAAAQRFEEATRWDPNFAEAYLRLGETRERQKNKKGAAEAYAKFLELAPDAKNAPEIKRKIGAKDRN
ncbi:MAG: tetratricopeptide repeat protein [Bryobacteraceae bacterium]